MIRSIPLFILVTLLTFSLGFSQSNTCCDSLLKLAKSKTVKINRSIGIKPTDRQDHDINITIDNSHSANNYALGQTDSIDASINNSPRKSIPKVEGLKWSNYFKPSIDLLIAIIGAIGLVWKYLIQKQKEFAEKIIESKRAAYSKFLENFTETAVKIMHDENIDSMEEDRERMFARNQLLLYANDKVIKAYHNWIEYADKEQKDINREVELFGIVLIEIRKDIHGKSKVTEQEISNLNPFNRG